MVFFASSSICFFFRSVSLHFSTLFSYFFFGCLSRDFLRGFLRSLVWFSFGCLEVSSGFPYLFLVSLHFLVVCLGVFLGTSFVS